MHFTIRIPAKLTHFHKPAPSKPALPWHEVCHQDEEAQKVPEWNRDMAQ